MRPILKSHFRRLLFAAMAFLILSGLEGCVLIFRGVRTDPIATTPASERTSILTPVKVHLIDGSTVLYRNGVDIRDGTLTGPGTRYGLTLTDSADARAVPLDSVAAMESFTGETNAGLTLLVSTLVTAALIEGFFLASHPDHVLTGTVTP